MNSTKQTFDKASQDRLISTLAASDYVDRYLNLCINFEADRELDGPRLDLTQTVAIFKHSGMPVQLDKRFKVIKFE